MKHNKNRYMAYGMPHSVKGFTLIEFLVASMLAMIVIVATSSTYMITRKLNHSAQERISVQQDIRNASVQMARDARMAGSFGCFNTGGSRVSGVETKFDSVSAKHATARDIVRLGAVAAGGAQVADGYGIRVIDKADLRGFSGLSNPSDALLFIYGQAVTAAEPEGGLIDLATYNSNQLAKSRIDRLKNVHFQLEKDNTNPNRKSTDDANVLKRALEENGDVVISTCSSMAALNGVNGFANNTVNLVPTELRFHDKQTGELSISKLHASLYVLGDIARANQWTGEKALLRYDLAANGQWQNPQLLATGIQSMSFAFGYVNTNNACKAAVTSPTNSETFVFVDDPSKKPLADVNNLPALVQVRLKYYANKATANSKAADAQVRDYIINTTVRAGNDCANRLTS